MPADDLILNVRQIEGYPSTGQAASSDAIVLQRGGLGGPYFSINAPAFVGSALASGGDMSIAGMLAAQSLQVGKGQFSNLAASVLTAQTACFSKSATLRGLPVATLEDVAAVVTSFNSRTGDVCLGIEDIVGAGGAPNFSPVLGGEPRAPTPAAWSHSTRLATTAFVHRNSVEYINNLLACHPFVFSFNGRSGDVVLTEADITAALEGGTLPLAPLDSPNFSGVPTAPTAPEGSVDGQIATTAFVANAIAEGTAGVASFNGRTGIVVLSAADLSAAGGALLSGPAFSGTPTAPTAPLGTNTTQIATTAFVLANIGGSFAPLNSPAFTGVPTAPTAALNTNTNQIATTAFVLASITEFDAGVLSFNGRTGAVNLIANDISAAGGAVLASPAFTGNPTAPTQAPTDNSTRLATTAYVTAATVSATPTATTFTVTGTGTYTPPAGVRYIRVRMVGGGGGGGGVVGTNAGGAGGNSSFLGWTALGGAGGAGGGASGAPGTGGVGGTGGANATGNLVLRLQGGIGGSGQVNNQTTVLMSALGGGGGSTPFGSSPVMRPPVASPEVINTGAGGTGAFSSTANIGAAGGGGGGEYVEFYVPTPSAGAISVGAAGAGGVAGGGGVAGSAGQPGLIVVEEFYR